MQSTPAAARGAAAALAALPAPILAPAAADTLQGLAAVACVQVGSDLHPGPPPHGNVEGSIT